MWTCNYCGQSRPENETICSGCGGGQPINGNDSGQDALADEHRFNIRMNAQCHNVHGEYTDNRYYILEALHEATNNELNWHPKVLEQ